MSAGKGPQPRAVKGDEYRSNYERIFSFGKSKCEDCGGKLIPTGDGIYEHGFYDFLKCKCGSVYEKNAMSGHLKKQTRYNK